MSGKADCQDECYELVHMQRTETQSRGALHMHYMYVTKYMMKSPE